jgi:hypothetical protein
LSATSAYNVDTKPPTDNAIRLLHYEAIVASPADWSWLVAAVGALVLVFLLLFLWLRVQRAAVPDSAHREASSSADALGRYALIYAREDHASLLAATLSLRCVRVTGSEQLAVLVASEAPAVAFIDIELLPQLAVELERFPVVAILDEPANARLPSVVRSFDRFGALAHVIASQVLTSPQAKAHLDAIVDRLLRGAEHDPHATSSIGRVAMLAQASHRETRFERMRDFFARHGVSTRMTSALNDVAEELVMNALYNAPAEAGYFDAPVLRTDDVTLPVDRACEISYGLHEGNAFIRVRDPFGSLRRERVIQVLARCLDTAGAALDESRGGAGLGMCRVFSTATTIAITVLPGRLTDVLVEVALKGAKDSKLLAIDLNFVTDDRNRDLDPLMLELDSQLLDNSVTLVTAMA